MRILMVHQNFPGQFRDIAPALCERGHDLKAISGCGRSVDSRVEVLRYEYSGDERQGIHPLTGEIDEWIRRSELVAQQASSLKQRHWAPDVILAHPGWGEAMLLKAVFPASPLVVWPELWLKPEHMGIQEKDLTIEQAHYLRIKNWLVDGAMADAQRAILPTRYQARSFPERWENKLNVIPEGIDENLFSQARLRSLTLSPEVVLGPTKQVLTFISRNLEPMRGFHLFMRALPEVQQSLRNLETVIVGGDGVSYSSSPGEGQTWKEVLLKELEGRLDMSRIHFLGRIPHPELIKLYRRSDLHVYLSNAFVLSWSLMEVMATGTKVLTADNAMLREINEFSSCNYTWNSKKESLGNAITQAIAEVPETGRNGVQALQERYGLKNCVLTLETLLEEIASGLF
jgi:glycosyltransferase involved in cell wall biosynthesis